jgi:hypothetical protein
MDSFNLKDGTITDVQFLITHWEIHDAPGPGIQ